MRTVASEVETPEAGGDSRPKSRFQAARKSRLRRMALEGLEARTLLSTSTLPAATPGTPIELNPTTNPVSGQSSSPQIAIDRYNPNKLVSVWVQDVPTAGGTQKVFVEGAYSNDGGLNWTSFNGAPPTLIDPLSPSTGPYVYSEVTDPSVGFDTNNDVYILVDEHSVDLASGPASGALLLEKFDFSGSSPQLVPFTNIYTGNQQNYNVLYQWSGAPGVPVDAIASPTMAVDDNQASFTDPTTNQTQTDPNSNDVYVAWATNTNGPSGANDYNPNTIQMIASDDGGQTFTTPVTLNSGGTSGNERDAAPQLAISQGRLADTAVYGPTDTGVPGGQVTAVWDDFGSLSAEGLDEIVSDTVTNSATADAYAGTSGTINKAFAGASGSPNIPQITTFTDNVNLTTDPTFANLNDLAVTMNLLEPSTNTELSAVLIAPDGAEITLFTNAVNAAGLPTGNAGISGNNLGIASNGQELGTTFDDHASRTISDPTSASPYIGTYRPEFGSLLQAFGVVPGTNKPITAADLSGQWTLQITDYGVDANNPSPTLVNWSLKFTSGLSPNPDNVRVGTTSVRGTFDGNLFPSFGNVVPSDANGVGPAPVIASDNTLGSFSPNQGTLYVAYVVHDNSVSSNPSSNTDIALATSTDGGQSWTIMTDKVNDDDATTDGFSGSLTPSDALNDTDQETGNSQYMPAITVDQATGTMVLSWRDARYSGTNSLVVTEVTTSIDGGQTFSPDVYVNASNTGIDATTGNTVTVSPQQDNDATGETDADLGFGTKMGITAFDGKVFVAWSGNGNQQTVLGAVPLTVNVNPVLIAAGPRVVSSTMGPVGGAGDTLNTETAADGTPMPTTIEVTFDRPIDPSAVATKTFTTSAVEVFYNSTTGAPPVPLDVTAVKPIVTADDPDNDGRFGYTQWLITFDPTKLVGGALPSNITDFTGTYSYLIRPVISDEVRSYQITNAPQTTITQVAKAPNVPVTIPAVPVPDTLTSQITLSGHPNQVIADNVNGPGVTINLSLTDFNDDALDITLTSPSGVTVTLFDDPYAIPGANFTNTTFSDSAAQSILTATAPYTGTFQPGDATGLTTNTLAAMNGGVVDGTWTLTITNSLASNSGKLTNWGLTVNSEAPSTTATLQDGNLMDQNADGTGGEDATVTPFTGTTPGDVYAVPAPNPTVPTTYDLNDNIVTLSGGGGGSGATAIATVSGGVITGITLTDAGTGYTSTPTVTIGGGGTGATATATISGGVVTGITLTAGGMDYDDGSSAPFPQGPYDPTTLPLIVPGPHIVSTSVPAAGAQGTADNLVLGSSVTISGVGTGATATDTIVNGAVTGITLTAGGSGYTSAPTITISGGTGATATATVANGVVTGITLISGGTGYTATPTVSALDLTFDRDMNPSSFTAADILQIMGPSGLISGPQTYTLPTASQDVTITGGSTTPISSTITVPNDSSTFPLAALSVQVSLLYQPTSDLTVYLVSPSGAKLLLFSGIGKAGLATSATTPTTLTFSDTAASSILTQANTADPLSGTYKAQGGTLSSLIYPNGGTTPIDAQGNWTLQITDNNSLKTVSGTLQSWSLIATPQLSVTPLMDGKTPGTTRTFQVNFPQQELSGTYTVEVAPTITSAAGDEVDTNLNAGLDVLRGEATNNATTQVTYSASNLPQTIPSATAAGNGIVTSTIDVPDNFLVQGIVNGLSGLTVQLNVTDPSDSTLQAELIYHEGEADEVIVPLFTDVGSGPNAANFTNTVFDDQATTPIQSGGAPFFGTYNAQAPLLSSSFYGPGFAGLSSAGAWTLELISSRVAAKGAAAATLNSWSLSFQKPLPSSGLGEPNTDDISASFRIFAMSASDPLASATWTAVGPAGIDESAAEGGGDGYQVTATGTVLVTDAGQVAAIAVDPSDPSGNTVYIGAASGGIWKTTDFLTTSPLGPTWIPLTDFGPTFSLNIGSIAIFPRNDNPNDSIIIASTGDGNAGSEGVGFLRSEDGGATWTLLDSTTNVDSSGNVLAESSTSRDHVFVGDTSYQVVVDPTPTVSGGVIIYAALSGPTGGIWRSEDTGNTWQLMLPGNATSVTLAPDSGTGGNGELQIVYAGMANPAGSGTSGTAAGVYLSPDQGQVWNSMTGTVGNPLIINPATGQNVNPVTNGATDNPNDPDASRIELVTPALTGNAVEDKLDEGWLYAVVVTSNGSLGTEPEVTGGSGGLYETKDFGETWTLVSLPNALNVPVDETVQADPTSNTADSNYDVAGSAGNANGALDISLTVDPTNANIVYLGGSFQPLAPGGSSGLIRIDTTDIQDAHNTFYSTGALQVVNANQPTGLDSQAPVADAPVPPNQYLNLIRDPASPFESNATLDLINGAAFSNNGSGVTWIPFDIGGTGIYQMVSETDPLTGLPRLIIGDNQGVFTAVDNNGTIDQSVGNVELPSGTRNGNLQIAQFYYGAAQPSNVAAQAAQALLYGSSDDDGGPASDPNVLTDGNITWSGVSPLGDAEPLGQNLGAAGVATNQQGGTGSTAATTAEYYQYWWPDDGGDYTNFFQLSQDGNTSIGRTYGLLQSSDGLPTPDPQWVVHSNTNFTVNPINGQQIIISAPGNNNGIGRIFATEDGGETWQVIGQPTALDNSYAPALAYGAPDPTAPAGIGNLDNFIYAGTTDGNIFVTQTGGGANGNQWSEISTGLDGSTVEQIVTDPTRGSHDAYAVTQDGVYYIANSITLVNELAANAAAVTAGTVAPYTAAQIAAAGWQNITNNLFEIMFNSLGDSSLAADLLQPVAGQVGEPNRAAQDLAMVLEQDGGLDAIVADWRYAIPTNPSEAVSATNPAYPVLYVAGGAGVYQSLNNGQTWSLFPTVPEGATQAGGLLPDAQVTSLTLDLGNIDVNTGLAVQTPGDPDVLIASTFGLGDYAIRVGPEITPTSVVLDPTLPGPAGSIAGTSNGEPLVTINDPVIDGFSEESADGNTVTVTLYNMANPTVPIGTGQTNAFGQFAVQITPGALTANGNLTIGVQATDSAGTVGNIVPLAFVLQTSQLGASTPPTTPTLALQASDDTSNGQDITSVTQPHLVGATSSNAQVSLLNASGTVIPVVGPNGTEVTSVTSNATTGAFSLQPYVPLNGNPATQYEFRAEATNANGTTYSPYVTFTVETVGPTTNVFQGLALADDTGVQGDNITSDRQPDFVGTTNPNAEVDLYSVLGSAVTISGGGGTGAAATATIVNGAVTGITVTSPGSGYTSPPTVTISDGTGAVASATVLNGAVTGITVTTPGSGYTTPTLTLLATTTANGSGAYTIQLPQDLTDGTIQLETTVQNAAGIQGPVSAVQTITIASVLGDYTGDGQANLALYQRTSATTGTWFIDGVTSAAGIVFGAGGADIPLVGDFNGDGISDLAYYQPSTSTFTIQLSGGGQLEGGSLETIPLGQTGDIPVVGNFDGTGNSEVGVYNPTTYIWTIDGANGIESFQFGQAGDVPVPGNYDGTGKDELALYNPSTAQYLIAGPSSTTTTLASGVQVITNPESVTVGTPNEVPDPAGYDNSFYFQGGVAERTEPAVYNPNTGQLTIFKFTLPLSSGTQTVGGVTYSSPNGTSYNVDFAPGDIIASGNYDGTGNDEPAAYDPSTAQFIVDGATGTVQYGQTGDIPVLAPYFYRQLATVTATPTIALNPADDTSHGQDITSVTQPRVIGVTSAGAQISLINVSTGAVIGSGFADTNGNYSVIPTNPLTDGTYQLEVQASGLNNVTLTSKVLTVTIDTSLQVVSVSPTNGSYNTGLPNNQVVVTFNHPLAGLIPNDPAGNYGFDAYPYAVFLAPQGPNNEFMPLHGTLAYSVNSDGTSQITLTPTVPLGTDVYLVSISGLTDLAGNALPGPYYTTMEIRTTPFNTSPVQVTSVTTDNGGVTINDSVIAQPDTIGIAFNKAMDALTINNNTVQLFAAVNGSYVQQPSAVAYSPTTQTAYLTPEGTLSPGTVYVVSVSGSVSDDLNFPSVGDTLGASYYDTFMVTSSGTATSQTPLQVLSTSPANGAFVTQPLGYAAVKFSEALSPTAIGRYSAMLIPNPGPPNNFVPLNQQYAFNPNTNQLIIVPTVPLGNATYVISLSDLSATNGDPLIGANGQPAGNGAPPYYATFGYQVSSLSASSVSQGAPEIMAESVPVSQSTAMTVNPTTAATNVPVTTTTTTTTAKSKARVRPAQAAAKARDAALEEALSSVHSLLSARRRALTSGVKHVTGSDA